VSIGNDGSEAFTGFGPFADYLRLFSSHDQDPPTPVWQLVPVEETFHHGVDSAEASDLHAVIYDVYADSGLQQRRVLVRKHSTLSPGADWTYTYPFQTNGHENLAVRVSRDGSRIVSVLHNAALNRSAVAVFTPFSAVPIAYHEIPLQGPAVGFEISSDGSQLYLASTLQVRVHSLPSGALLHQELFFEPIYKAHGFSGDGSVFAYGTNNRVKVYRRPTSGGAYSLAFSHEVPGPAYCPQLALSADGSTLVACFNYSDTFRRVDVRTIDVPSQALIALDSVVGVGPYQNVAADVSVSADGQRSAVGVWGDDTGNAHELRVYRRGQNVPIATYDLPGSVFELDLSGDGRRLAVASKAVHANVSGGGGSVQLYRVNDEDFVVSGAPEIGHTVTFSVRGTPGQSGRLLYSPFPAANPTYFNGIGTLYLDRMTVQSFPMGLVGGNGYASLPFPVPGLIGQKSYFQGMVSSPRTLSNDWIELTILP
jgi:WD40 repeat protein